MILVHRHHFGVSRWHAEQLRPRGRAPRAHEKGLVMRVRVRFAHWLGGNDVEADAFVDPGADTSVLSWRWAALAWDATGRQGELDYEGDVIREDVFVIIHGCSLRLPATAIGPSIMPQDVPPQPGDMPGWEDLLLGRDFLSAHKLLLVVDGDRDGGRFSMLLPDDDDNRAVRAAVMAAFEPRGSQGGAP